VLGPSKPSTTPLLEGHLLYIGRNQSALFRIMMSPSLSFRTRSPALLSPFTLASYDSHGHLYYDPPVQLTFVSCPRTYDVCSRLPHLASATRTDPTINHAVDRAVLRPTSLALLSHTLSHCLSSRSIPSIQYVPRIRNMTEFTSELHTLLGQYNRVSSSLSPDV